MEITILFATLLIIISKPFKSAKRNDTVLNNHIKLDIVEDRTDKNEECNFFFQKICFNFSKFIHIQRIIRYIKYIADRNFILSADCFQWSSHCTATREGIHPVNKQIKNGKKYENKLQTPVRTLIKHIKLLFDIYTNKE